VRLPIALYVIALVARAIPAWLHPDPAYPDSTYYVGVARSLAAGRGFSLDFIWNFVDVGGRLPQQPTLPITSNAHWMPLASVIQVPFTTVLGPAPIVALIPFVLIGATVAPLTWAIARDAGLSSAQATAAGLMAAVPGAVLPFLGQPDNFALFMPLGALALWLCSRGLRGDVRAFVVGGLVVGVATLARNDGVLLGVPFALGWFAQRWRAWRTRRRAPAGDSEAALPFMPALSFSAAVGCLLGFLIAMGPWYARQLAVFGALSPSAASGRILWIRNYGELFSVTGDPSLGTFLSQGLGPLIQSRVDGFYWAFTILAALPFLFFLVPFVLWAGWRRRGSVLFGPWIVYAITLLLFSGLLFAVHVRYGTFLHSAVAVVPHAYVLGVEGIGLAVAWVARRRRHWNVPLATRNFTAIAVIVLALGAAGATWKTVESWGVEASVRQGASAQLAKLAQPGDRLMSADPGAYRYYAGLGGVVTPADPIGVVEDVARAYDIRWLVLERAHIVDAFAPIYVGTPPQPDWLVGVADAGDAPIPTWRVFAVCLSAQDQRSVCQHATGP
jgi:hypothetical protein